MDFELVSDDRDAINQAQLEEYEKYLLAVSLHSPAACSDIISKLESIDFSTVRNQILYSAIQELTYDNVVATPVTILEKLKTKNQTDKVGGVSYITEISKKWVTDEGYEIFVEIIFKYSLYRKLERAIDEIKILKNSSTGNSYELVQKAQEKILDIKVDIAENNIEELNTIVSRVIEQTFLRAENANALTGVDTGFSEVDNLTGGWQNGDFIILAARPSMGKTALALNLATNAAEKKNNVAIFSLEMPKEQLVQRIISSQTYIDSKKIRTGQGITSDEDGRLKSVSSLIGNLNIYIDDTPGINILQFQNKLRKLQRDHEIDLCIIDYLQLIGGIPTKNENRQNEVSTISRQIKKLARELSIPIICLSQLSRNVEQREDKKPLMSDLRDSGAIEQDADIIMFLYRAEYYTKNSDDEGKAELIFAKHRNGSTGSIELNFLKDYGQFNNK